MYQLAGDKIQSLIKFTFMQMTFMKREKIFWFPKKPVVDDKEKIIDEDSYKYQIQPVVSFSAVLSLTDFFQWN